MSPPQLHGLQQKYIPALLNKIGIIRTYPHSLVFGSRDYGGIGCNDLRIEQGLASVENLVRQMRTPGYGKDIATVFLRWNQHASGLSQPLLQYPAIRAPHLDGYYYSSLRSFLARSNGSLEIDCVPSPTHERCGDEYIMDVVCSPLTTTSLQLDKLLQYTDMDIRKLYWCKSYLQVKRLSDLCTADGIFILPSILKGERSIRQCSSRLGEINQQRPNEATWGVWRKFLKTLCDRETDPMYNLCSTGCEQTKAIGQRLRLHLPLGDWRINANDSERLWPFYYSNSNNILYRSFRKDWHTQGVFSFDCHQGSDDETFAYVKFGDVTTLPDDAVPVDVKDAVKGWRIAFYQAMEAPEEPDHSDNSFMTALLQQPEHISQYFTQVDFHTVPFQTYEYLKSSRRVLIATDGGAVPLKGSLGFVVADDDANILATCFGQPSGHDPLSFRSEICAFLAAVTFIKVLIQHYDTNLPCSEKVRGKFQFYTDSLSMIKKLKAFNKYPTASLSMVLDSEWDVLSALDRVLKWFPTYPKINWVKSHQDDKVYIHTDMPVDAYLNSEADELATIGLKRLQEKPRVPMDPFAAIQFHLNGRTITRDLKQSVRTILSLPPLRKYYCNKFSWSDTVFDTVDWDIFRPVYRRYVAKNGIQWMHKFCMGKLPTGERVQKRDPFHDKRCASCWHTLEDDNHIFTCVKRKIIRRRIIKQTNILSNKLCDILQEGLMAYFMGECMTNTMLRIRGQKGMARYKLLIDEQLLIGWDNLLRGKFTKQWKIQQHAYMTRQRLRDPALYARKLRAKKRKEDKGKYKPKKKKTESFHSFFQAIVPIIKEIWTARCIDRHTPIEGGRIVAEYDALSKKVTQLYTMREMVLPEDEMKIFNEPLELRLEATNQQLKKWLLRWRPVIDHSMKKVREMAQSGRNPIWKHFTAEKPAKTKVTRKTSTRKHDHPKRMMNNPLTNVLDRIKPSKSTSKALPTVRIARRPNNIMTNFFTALGKRRSTSRVHPVLVVEEQNIDDRFGDAPI